MTARPCISTVVPCRLERSLDTLHFSVKASVRSMVGPASIRHDYPNLEKSEEFDIIDKLAGSDNSDASCTSRRMPKALNVTRKLVSQY